MFYPQNRNGNMPVVRERPRHIRLVIVSPARMRIITGTAALLMEKILNKLMMWVGMLPTHGADMHGNVWEWTADFYHAHLSRGNPVIDPTHPGNLGSHRVKRGGGWGDGSGTISFFISA